MVETQAKTRLSQVHIEDRQDSRTCEYVASSSLFFLALLVYCLLLPGSSSLGLVYQIIRSPTYRSDVDLIPEWETVASDRSEPLPSSPVAKSLRVSRSWPL